MAFLEDLTPFFSTAEFADLASIGGADVQVIFEAPSADPFGPAVDTTQPQCWAPSASVQHAHQGTAVVIGTKAYTVERIEPDGTGISRITLYPTAC